MAANVTLKAPTASTPGSVVFFRDGSSAVIDGSSNVSCPQEFVSDLINLGFTGDYAASGEGVTGGDNHDHADGDGAQLDHGGLAGLADDDHPQYVKHSLAIAAWDFLISIGSGSPTTYAWVKKTLAEVKAALSLGGSVPAPVAANDFILAAGSPLDWTKATKAETKAALDIVASVPDPTAANDFLIAAGSPLVWTKMTLAEVKTILGIS